MGACNSSPDAVENRKWEKELQRDKKKYSKEHKLLLLGTGNSGKSTFFKQLARIHGQVEENETVNESNQRHIQDAVVVQMKNILQTFISPEMDRSEELKEVDIPPDLKPSAARILSFAPEQPLREVADDIAHLWKHEIIREAYTNRTNLGIADSAPHFFDNLERIRQPDYVPTDEDVLLVRVPTTGIREQKFVISGSTFNIFDVGGQRNERQKWIHCFNTVHGILFVASLSCYDQNLFEENELNAMYEALNLFHIVATSRYFSQASLILFLNKSDLFEQKIKTKPLTVCFPDYEGENEYEEAARYITEQFKALVPPGPKDGKPKEVYAHLTCATDKNNVQRLFDDVQHTVVTNALKYNGLI